MSKILKYILVCILAAILAAFFSGPDRARLAVGTDVWLPAAAYGDTLGQIDAGIDIWVSQLRWDSGGNWTVCVRKQGATIPGGCSGVVRVNGSQVTSFTLSDSDSTCYGLGLLGVGADDTVVVVVDATKIVIEWDEANNWLRYITGDGTNGSCANCPSVLAGDYLGEGQDDVEALELIESTSYQTEKWPYAFLIIPPFEWDESWSSNDEMATILESATVEGSESEQATGVTAGLAIEASFQVTPFYQQTLGYEIEAETETALNTGVRVTQGQLFDAKINPQDWLSGEHIVVMCQTDYSVCKYRVSDGDQTNGTVVIAVPDKGGTYDNPELTEYRYSDYEAVKAEDAPNLYELHDVGDCDSYSSNKDHCQNHVEGNVTKTQTFVERGKAISTGGAEWYWTIENQHGTTHSKTIRQNFYATSEFSGLFASGSATVSFGSVERWSHQIYSGSKCEYRWRIGAVDSVAYEYRVRGLGMGLVFDHGTRTHDGLLLMCYAVDQQSAGGPWEKWEHKAEWYRHANHYSVEWPEKNTDALEDLLSRGVRFPDPSNYDPNEYFKWVIDLEEALEHWEDQFETTPIPGIDDFAISREELENLIIDLSDIPPVDDWVYVPALERAIEDVMEAGGFVFDPDPVDNVKPAFPNPNGPQLPPYLVIGYNPWHGKLDTAAIAVNLMYGFDEGWSSPTYQAMDYDSVDQVWSTELEVPPDAMDIYYGFTDGVAVDSNYGSWWHLPTAGDYRNHDNNNLNLSLTKHGALGFTDQGGSGEGLEIYGDPTNLLKIGSLWVGNEDFVANRDYIAEGNPGWEAETAWPAGIWRWEPPESLVVQMTKAVFTDSGLAAPNGLRVIQGGISRTGEDDDDFVIISYSIRNISEEPITVRAAQFADFDLNDPPMGDWGAVDSSLALAYMNDGGSRFVGVCALHAWPGPGNLSNETLIDVSSYSGAGYIPDSNKYLYMKGVLRVEETPSPSDWGVMVSTEPFLLDSRQQVEVGFAVVAGESEEDLKENAKQARLWYAGRVVVAVEEDTPEAVRPQELYQNCPNPFNPVTKMSFYIPHRTQVRFQIYDVRGRLVRTLRDEVMKAGEWQIPWDGLNDSGQRVSSGVYFYRLATEFGVQTRKMVLLK